MRRDPHPSREAAARRRLTALADAIAVPPPAPLGAGPDRRPAASAGERARRRRPALVAAAVGAAAAALVTALLVVGPGGDGGPGTGVTPAAADSCGGHAADGVVGAGTLADGTTWRVRVDGPPPDRYTGAQVGGEEIGAVAHDARSWPGLVDEGLLSLDARVTDRAVLVFGETPVGTARVRIALHDGTAVSVCPVAVRGDHDVVRRYAIALPPSALPTRAQALDGAGRALASGDLTHLLDASPSGGSTQMTIDPALVSLPLGGTPSEVPPAPVMHELVSGEAPAGPWSLATGLDGDHLVLQLDGPGDGRGNGGVQGTPEQLLGPDLNWHLDEVPGGLIAWGPVAADVASVAVTLAGGTEIEVEVLATVPGVPVRAFAAFLPEGDVPTAMESRTSSGTARSRADGVREAVDLLAAATDLGGVGMLVVPAS